MKKFIKSLIVTVFAFSFLFSVAGGVAFADASSDAAQVAALQLQLSALQATAQSLQAQAQANGVSATVSVAGCTGNTGFSTVTGGSCAGNALWYNFGSVTLKNGSTGEGVKELQRFLNAKLSLGLGVDGKLGPKTIVVIKKWQTNHGLVADGLIGAKTKVMMNASLY